MDMVKIHVLIRKELHYIIYIIRSNLIMERLPLAKKSKSMYKKYNSTRILG